MSDPKRPKPQPQGGLSERLARVERERSKPLEEHPNPSMASRFGGVEQGGGAQVEAVPQAARFQPAVETVEVDRNHDDEQPFVKCVRCGGEGGKFSTSCMLCGASFDSADQRAFNAQVWAERKRQLEEERAQVAARQAQLQADADELARSRHAMGVALAQEVKQQQQASWSTGSLSRRSWNAPLWDEDRPIFLILVTRLPMPFGPLIAGAIALGALAIVRWGGWGHSYGHGWHGWGWLGLLLLGGLFLPPSWWTRPARRRSWWD